MDKEQYLSEDFDAEKMKKEFEESYEILCKVNQPFYEKMDTLFKHKNINASNFTEKTGLNRQFFYLFISKQYVPNMNTFVSVCMGLELDLQTAESLLSALRHGFDKTDRIHCAYMFLITRYRGLDIEDCNRILNELGITEPKYLLGSFSNEDKKKISSKN